MMAAAAAVEIAHQSACVPVADETCGGNPKHHTKSSPNRFIYYIYCAKLKMSILKLKKLILELKILINQAAWFDQS
jgi:hypothetical protein